MHDGYPIEQLVQSIHTHFQSGFARMTMQRMPVFEGAALEPTARGLKILGINEMALVAPREFIRHIHGQKVQLDEPKVREVRYEGQLREPVMCLRVSIDFAHAEAAIRHLVARESSIDCVDWLHDTNSVLIRAQAPLRNLLGYPDVLADLSGGAADLKIWLSHYVAVASGPGDDAA